MLSSPLIYWNIIRGIQKERAEKSPPAKLLKYAETTADLMEMLLESVCKFDPTNLKQRQLVRNNEEKRQLLFHQWFVSPYDRCLGVKESCWPSAHQFACKLCHSVHTHFQKGVKCVGAHHGHRPFYGQANSLSEPYGGLCSVGMEPYFFRLSGFQMIFLSLQAHTENHCRSAESISSCMGGFLSSSTCSKLLHVDIQFIMYSIMLYAFTVNSLFMFVMSWGSLKINSIPVVVTFRLVSLKAY